MHRFTLLLATLALTLPLRAAPPPLIEEAIGKMAVNFDHWAYTETIVEKNGKGKVLSETVVRFDPSKPFADQFTVLSVDGKSPTPAQQKKWHKTGEQRAARIQDAENEGVTTPHKTIGELMDIERATPVSEDAATVVFEVPLKSDGSSGLPPDKFRLFVSIDRNQHTFVRLDGKLRKAFRTDLIFKVRAGEGHIVFSQVDPLYPPVITSISGNGNGTVLFVPLGRSYELHRTEFLRVKPYSDRFKVKMGPLKAIDF